MALKVDRWMEGHAMTTSELAEKAPAALRAPTMVLTWAVVPCAIDKLTDRIVEGMT